MSANIQIFDSEDGRFCLTAMIEEELPDAVFAEMELQGGGYTWEAVFRALLRMRLPQAVEALDIGAEADNMYAYSEDRETLEQTVQLYERELKGIEEQIAARFPTARVARLDRDTATGDGLMRILSAMHRREIDILIGTQMLAKGHDFPGVTLVGVVLADTGIGQVQFQPDRLLHRGDRVTIRDAHGVDQHHHEQDVPAFSQRWQRLGGRRNGDGGFQWIDPPLSCARPNPAPLHAHVVEHTGFRMIKRSPAARDNHVDVVVQLEHFTDVLAICALDVLYRVGGQSRGVQRFSQGCYQCKVAPHGLFTAAQNGRD